MGAIAGDALLWCSAPAKLQISTPYEYMIEHVLVVFVWRCTVADWLVYNVQYREISVAVSDAWEKPVPQDGRSYRMVWRPSEPLMALRRYLVEHSAWYSAL